jgi:hypothetical protein
MTDGGAVVVLLCARGLRVTVVVVVSSQGLLSIMTYIPAV